MYSSFYFLHYLFLLPVYLLNKIIIKWFSGLALLNSVLCIPTRYCLTVHSFAFSTVILIATFGWYNCFVSTLFLDKINPWGVALWPPHRSKSCKTLRETRFKRHLSTSRFLELDRESSGNKHKKREREWQHCLYMQGNAEFVLSCDWYVIITGFFSFCLPLTIWIWSFAAMTNGATAIFIFLT